jgi:hypothetical protein
MAAVSRQRLLQPRQQLLPQQQDMQQQRQRCQVLQLTKLKTATSAHQLHQSRGRCLVH